MELNLRQALATLLAAELQHKSAGARRHSFAKAMRACALSLVRLICALRGHENLPVPVQRSASLLGAPM
jgi:hypothetical protein